MRNQLKSVGATSPSPILPLVKFPLSRNNRLMIESIAKHIQTLDEGLEESILRNPLLNIDTFIIPSPYIRDIEISKDHEHSYAWVDEGEVLGYMQVYSDEQKMNFHIYKIVTSPFGRGRGIGNSFINHLSEKVDPDANIYLYLWEKQNDTIEYFQNKGFNVLEPVVYRNRRYYHLSASAKTLQEQIYHKDWSPARTILKEDIGKTRHDARKTIRLLSHLVDTLDLANAGRIIEDINRESTTLINMLNEFRDSVSVTHEINIQELILERIIPFINGSHIPCTVKLTLNSDNPMVMGYYISHSRALVNIISNALDAIAERGVPGLIEIDLSDGEDQAVLRIHDNGVGIPGALLALDERGVPKFVGQTSKGRAAGEGLGTIQVYETFGPDNISVISQLGVGSVWTIGLKRPKYGVEKWFTQLERRYHEFQDLIEMQHIDRDTARTEIIAFIWQLRKMEIFMYDIINQFGKEYNIREIYRSMLAYLEGFMQEDEVEKLIASYRTDRPEFRTWLSGIIRMIRKQNAHLLQVIDPVKYRGPLFRSYGQALNHVMIFTLDPVSGDFLATDRKLAEHLDFVPYLGGVRDALLRGEMVGDMNDHSQPILLGVWSVTSHEELLGRLKLLQAGAQRLIEKSVHREKKLAFYQVTYIQHGYEIDTDFVTTLGEFVKFSPDELKKCIREADDEAFCFLPIQD